MGKLLQKWDFSRKAHPNWRRIQAEIKARKKGKKYENGYDEEAETSFLVPGDRVLVQENGVQGQHKIGDI